MTPRTHLAFVVALVIAHCVAVATLRNLQLLTVWHDVASWLAITYATVGLVAAMTSFLPGDDLRRSWGLLLTSMVLLMIAQAMRSYWTHAAPGQPQLVSPLLPYRVVLIVLANVVGPYALARLALVHRRAGIELPSSPRFLLLLTASIAIFGTLAVQQIVRTLGRIDELGWLMTVTDMASTVADAVTLVLLLPILRAAQLLRGGPLARPWIALGIGGVAWLLYDLHHWLAELLASGSPVAQDMLGASRLVGFSMTGVAGFLQRHAIFEVMRARD